MNFLFRQSWWRMSTEMNNLLTDRFFGKTCLFWLNVCRIENRTEWNVRFRIEKVYPSSNFNGINEIPGKPFFQVSILRLTERYVAVFGIPLDVIYYHYHYSYSGIYIWKSHYAFFWFSNNHRCWNVSPLPHIQEATRPSLSCRY